MRATIEHNNKRFQDDDVLPDIDVLIVLAEENLSIKVANMIFC